ncbi:unnamed protein product [Paramecium octaurelia]|uniref:Uncharacterized protein n=1 Tax=Paramecium octaurelia TaxID=43137 RepID=A0A8S1Y480_PAROT|nr:unnamed protein product [Paramecium octaurelia]
MSQWIFRIHQCKSTNYTRDSPQVLYKACFQFTELGAVITGLLVGDVNTKSSYEEGLFSMWKSKLTKNSSIKILLSLVLPFIILIPFIFINLINVLYSSYYSKIFGSWWNHKLGISISSKSIQITNTR